jgi:hypothetical protein
MPAGHRKEIVRGVFFPMGSLPFLVNPPLRRVGTTIQIAWHLSLATGLPAGDETIEQCGDGATEGWLLQLLTTGVIRFSTFSAGPQTDFVDSSNALTVADVDKSFLVIASIAGTAMRVYLNETVATAVAVSPMAEPSPTAALELGAGGAFAAGSARAYRRWQTHVGRPDVLSLTTLYRRTRLAIRLEEPPACVSYIDFGRFAPELTNGAFSGSSGYFGDDCTGARVSPQPNSTNAQVCEIRADRAADWSTA